MDERKRQVLQAIIDDYISTAEPIGSRTIARKCGLGVSPATIRNEMSDLEALGFLEQPHASAGRIPSAKGYRFYVDCLMGPQQLSERDAQLINQWFDQKVRRLDEAFQETVKVLSRITRNVSLLVTPRSKIRSRSDSSIPQPWSAISTIASPPSLLIRHSICFEPAG